MGTICIRFISVTLSFFFKVQVTWLQFWVIGKQTNSSKLYYSKQHKVYCFKKNLTCFKDFRFLSLSKTTVFPEENFWWRHWHNKYHRLIQSYCWILTQFCKTLPFPPSCYGFLIIGTNSTVKSLGTKSFIYIFLITFIYLNRFMLIANERLLISYKRV